MLSIAVTSYNRSDLTVESFSKVWDHPLISEIVIVDDFSESHFLIKLTELVRKHPCNKIRFYRNPSNLGMSRNKAEAISKCKNEWVILFDSDNVLEPEYIDSAVGDKEGLKHISNFPATIYCPTFAKPDFDFTDYADHVIDKNNAKNYLQDKMFRVFLNCANYLVNREKYLEVYQYDPNIKEADTIHFNTLWLKAGYSFYFVPGMKYFHRVHKDSGWLSHHKQNIEDANRLQKIIAEL